LNTLLLLIAGGIFLYLLIYKPEIIAVLFFTITIADINAEVPGLPLNARAVIGLALLVRALIPEKGLKYPSFFSTNAKYIIFFLVYGVMITIAYDLVDLNFIKTYALTAVSAYCGYYYFCKKGDFTYLKLSVILAGIICFADLTYSYAVIGHFPVQRIYLALLKVPVLYTDNGDIVEIINHNFYGLICGISFVLLINEYINKRNSGKYILILLPLMFLGVLMSTSRSSLLGIIGISIFLIGWQLRSKQSSRKALKLITLAVSILFLSLFLFATVQQVFDLKSEFMENITQRLVDEPVAVFYKHMGFNYNAQSLDALEWRGEASSDAYEAYLNLKPVEQVFGIGFWGFVVRNLGRNNLPPHNGMLLLLIENGLVGLFLYFLLVFSIIRDSLKKQKNISPLITILIFIIIYCIGQNGELTSSITFLFVVSLIAENKYIDLNRAASQKINPSSLYLKKVI
jgi:O-Antigen ligase